MHFDALKCTRRLGSIKGRWLQLEVVLCISMQVTDALYPKSTYPFAIRAHLARATYFAKASSLRKQRLLVNRLLNLAVRCVHSRLRVQSSGYRLHASPTYSRPQKLGHDGTSECNGNCLLNRGRVVSVDCGDYYRLCTCLY